MMTYTIEKQLLNIPQKSLKKGVFIIAHESGNPKNTGTDALEKEVRYMTQQAKQGGAFTSHWVGGGGRVIQLAKTGKIQYGAGSKANPYAFAQVELARTNQERQFKLDYAAYVQLLQDLAKEAGLPLTLNAGSTVQDAGIKTHHWISQHIGGTNHSDPDSYLKQFGVSIAQFRKDIEKKNKPIIPSTALTHKVVKGDTLWGIAKRYHLTVTELKKINALPSEVIYVGQKLYLQPSDQTDEVKEWIIQIQYTVGVSPDGRFGPKTKKAVLQLFQRAVKVYPDGIWDKKTAAASRVLKQGTEGWDVYAVQAMLIGKGYQTVGVPDKKYGKQTTKAIQQYQKDQGLIVDGKCGPKTQEQLFSRV